MWKFCKNILKCEGACGNCVALPDDFKYKCYIEATQKTDPVGSSVTPGYKTKLGIALEALGKINEGYEQVVSSYGMMSRKRMIEIAKKALGNISSIV